MNKMKTDDLSSELNKNGIELCCSWCQSKDVISWCNKGMKDEALKCDNCNLIYMKEMPSSEELHAHYRNYESSIHKANTEHTAKRQKMYNLELNIIEPFLKKNSSILDVGCANGDFLRLFNNLGHKCSGVEIGEESFKKSVKVFDAYHGEFPNLEINKKFDLIIFRGTIEHFLEPRLYLEKAVSLLNDSGLIFITSTPNSNSLCCELYRERWNQFHPIFHLFHFSDGLFDKFFRNHNMKNIHRSFPYLETPYSNLESDMNVVRKAIERIRNNEEIDSDSPAFFGNMMSLVYRKLNE